MDNIVSFLHLLTAVGQNGSQQFGSFDPSQLTSLHFSHDCPPPTDTDTYMEQSPSFPQEVKYLSDRSNTDDGRQGCGAYSDNYDEELEEGNNFSQELPNDDGVLFDYEFPITDAKRDELDPPEKNIH